MLHSSGPSPRIQMRAAPTLLLALALSLAGCETPAPKPPPPASTAPPKVAPPLKAPPTGGVAPPPAAEPGALRRAAWLDLPDWQAEDPAAAWDAFVMSCRTLGKQEAWRDICSGGASMGVPGLDTARLFFEAKPTPTPRLQRGGHREGPARGPTRRRVAHRP